MPHRFLISIDSGTFIRIRCVPDWWSAQQSTDGLALASGKAVNQTTSLYSSIKTNFTGSERGDDKMGQSPNVGRSPNDNASQPAGRSHRLTSGGIAGAKYAAWMSWLNPFCTGQ